MLWVLNKLLLSSASPMRQTGINLFNFPLFIAL
jgi:hypothetical protein